MYRLIFFPVIFSLCTSICLADDIIYKWTDDQDVKHYTNQRQNIDESIKNGVDEIKFRDKSGSEEIKDHPGTPGEPDKEDYEQETATSAGDQETIRKLWRSKMYSIEKSIAETEQQLEATQKRIKYLEREIDYMLINGYSADLMIYELRNLERRTRPLEMRIELLEQEKEQLRKEARKEGIPPGYLRP